VSIRSFESRKELYNIYNENVFLAKPQTSHPRITMISRYSWESAKSEESINYLVAQSKGLIYNGIYVIGVCFLCLNTSLT
jgi:hypothetical protein